MTGEHAMNARRSRVGKVPDEHTTCAMSGCAAASCWGRIARRGLAGHYLG